MNDLFSQPKTFAAVMFPGSTRTYDYILPFEAKVGDSVIVETRRGDATVEIVEIKTHSDRATVEIKRLAETNRHRPF